MRGASRRFPWTHAFAGDHVRCGILLTVALPACAHKATAPPTPFPSRLSRTVYAIDDIPGTAVYKSTTHSIEGSCAVGVRRRLLAAYLFPHGAILVFVNFVETEASLRRPVQEIAYPVLLRYAFLFHV